MMKTLLLPNSTMYSISKSKFSYICILILTLFRSEFEFKGSSAANIAEDTIMQTKTTLPK